MLREPLSGSAQCKVTANRAKKPSIDDFSPHASTPRNRDGYIAIRLPKQQKFGVLDELFNRFDYQLP